MFLRSAIFLWVLAHLIGCGKVMPSEPMGVEVRFVLPEVLERKLGRREKFLTVATQARISVFVVEKGRDVRVCEHQVDFKAGSSRFLEGCRGSGKPASVRAEVWEAGWKRKLAEGRVRILREQLEAQSTVFLKIALKVPVGEFDP